MIREKIIEYLKCVEFFKNFNSELLEYIADRIKLEKFEKREFIFKEGTVGDKMYILIEGKVVLSKMDCDKELVVRVLTPVCPVGEMAILDGEPRSLSVKSVSDETKVLSLSKDIFKKIVFENPEIAFQIFKILSMRLRDTNRQIEKK